MKKILVISNFLGKNNEFLVLMLGKNPNLNVVTASGIEESLSKFKKSDYDLIIADTTSPLLSNFDLPIIFWVNNEQLKEALDVFYQKSFALEKMKSFIGQKVFVAYKDQEERSHFYGFLESVNSESIEVKVSRHGGVIIETEKIIKILDDKGFVVYGMELD